MKNLIKNLANLFEGVGNELIVIFTTAFLEGAFLKYMAEIMSNFKNVKLVKYVLKTLSIITYPIFKKAAKKMLGYSEEDSKNIYDIIRDLFGKKEKKKKFIFLPE